MRVPERKKIGWRAEKRIAKFLSVLGKVSFRKSKESSGSWGYPDVRLECSNSHTDGANGKIFGIETKSTYGFTKQGVGSICLYTYEWESLVQFCKENGFTPRLLMEIRAARPNIYFLFTPEYVSERLSKVKELVHITVWQAIHNGIMIRNQGELLEKWG